MTEKVMCANSVDYSQVEGNRVLPFRFTLDLAKSVLYPNPERSRSSVMR